MVQILTSHRLLLSTLLLSCAFSTSANSPNVAWSNETHQPHFADINGDGISDLLLQANTAADQSSLTLGTASGYLLANQQVLPARLSSGSSDYGWDITQAHITLADFNGDGLADFTAVLPGDYVTLTYFATADGLDLTTRADVDYTSSDLPLLSDGADFSYHAGDFNGDGRQDLLAVSAQKDQHYLMHSDISGHLSVSQQIKKNVKWGKNKAEKLLIGDYNADGRDDVFAIAKKKNQAHYVVFADANGLFNKKNTQKVTAKIDDKDWDLESYSVAIDNTNGDHDLELVRLWNAPGGIDENGIEVDMVPQASAKSLTYTVNTAVTGTTFSVASVPATPSSPIYTSGSAYKAIHYPYSVSMPAVSGASYYQLFEVHTYSESIPADSSYQLVYSGSSTTTFRTISSNGYRAYKYKACNASGCSGLSPWRRFYVYQAPGAPTNLSISPAGVNTGDTFTVSWSRASGAVDGTVYSLYQAFNNSETLVYSVTRQHWSELNYGYTTSKSVGGSYRYRVEVCSPNVGCSGSGVAYQTVIAPNRAPVANSDYVGVNEDNTIYINVQGNDSDADGDSLTTEVYGTPSHGSVSVINNQLRYAPSANFHGTDIFSYWVRDTSGAYSNPAAVNVTVYPVNDVPVGSVTISGQTTVGQTLTAIAALTDVDGGMSSFNYQWSRNGVGIAGMNYSSYTLVAADAGQPMTVTVTYLDSGNTWESVTSAPTAAIAGPAAQSQIIFMHSDLLGSPAVETNQNGGAL